MSSLMTWFFFSKGKFQIRIFQQIEMKPVLKPVTREIVILPPMA